MKRTPTPKSRYFLAELIINCLFFVISASVCLNLFAFGYTQSTQSRTLSMSTLKAQNMAECIKASNNDIDKLCTLTGAVDNGDYVTAYYDEEWAQTTNENAPYKLNVIISTDSYNMLSADIDVYEYENIIYELNVKRYIG